MSNYTYNVTAHTTARELPDLWSPFALNKYGTDNVFITPLDVRHGDSPYIGMCYTENGTHVTEIDQLGWSAVSGLTSRSSDIQHPSETIEGSTLLGLEPGIYQCVIVDMLYCEGTHCPVCNDFIDYCQGHGDIDTTGMEDGECNCDLTVGWALMKVDDE